MKKAEVLLKEAKKIIIQEHLSYTPKTTFNSKVGKRLRKSFMLTCMAEIGTSFTSRIAGYMSTE
jgi:hypothetical protein